LREDSDPLVVADRIGTHAGQTSEFPRSEGFGRSTHSLVSMNPGIGSRVKHFLESPESSVRFRLVVGIPDGPSKWSEKYLTPSVPILLNFIKSTPRSSNASD